MRSGWESIMILLPDMRPEWYGSGRDCKVQQCQQAYHLQIQSVL